MKSKHLASFEDALVSLFYAHLPTGRCSPGPREGAGQARTGWIMLYLIGFLDPNKVYHSFQGVT